MRRAVILITTLTVLAFGLGGWLDAKQARMAGRYLELIDAMQPDAAEERYLSALWEHDSRWLKILISHHHIREVDAALAHLREGVEGGWEEEIQLALGELREAFEDIQTGHVANWMNIL